MATRGREIYHLADRPTHSGGADHYKLVCAPIRSTDHPGRIALVWDVEGRGGSVRQRLLVGIQWIKTLKAGGWALARPLHAATFPEKGIVNSRC
jgi:hypothetical protein